MQNIVCDFERCGCRSQSGFCLNRLVKITREGQCERLLKKGWEKPIEKEYSSNFNYWLEQEKKENAGAGPAGIETGLGDDESELEAQNRGQSKTEDVSRDRVGNSGEKS